MVYPIVVLAFATLVLIFMLLFIVPVFEKVFDDLGGELPTLDADRHRDVEPAPRASGS